ncbi:MAG: sel1 repeat family protein [Desulfobulbaceae bacterium]|uniref:Sel1 repeat family protein n=1 Tax=Candidatus Desulfatifera sulfidica TaxID=2841691 RepID=A0A8J6TE69_9BACT|nr:sel1 repeat family protein [Candidatus Desulfatifera sulfidica]
MLPCAGVSETSDLDREDQILELAMAGDAGAQFSLALRYEFGAPGVVPDTAVSAAWFKKAAEGGISGAYLYLGLKYENGSGITQNLRQAAICYCQAADDDWAAARYFLAVLYQDGRGVPQDDRIALAWYRLAAEQGYPGAEEGVKEMSDRMGQEFLTDLAGNDLILTKKACAGL